MSQAFYDKFLASTKKTTNIDLLIETGKLPVSYNIFCSIYKYWVRTFNCESDLVKEALQCNKNNLQKGGQSWCKMVMYLLKLTKMEDKCPTNDPKANDKLIECFKTELKKVMTNSLLDELKNSKKLEFLSKYKKTFKYESYLDTVPKHLRVHVPQSPN